MIVFTPPTVPNGHPTNTLFLAGSIEMGKAVHWQKQVVEELDSFAGCIFNPRREDFDPSWSADSPELAAQINWELDRLGESKTIFFYFQGDTLSPISLLELGMTCAWSEDRFGPKVIVVCEPAFWRRTNIVVTCACSRVKVHDSLGAGIEALKEIVKNF